MAETVNIYDAKIYFFRLIERVEAGDEIVIARAGRPVARLVPLRRASGPRIPGRWREQITIAPDFDAPNARIARDFER